ncbi:MAG: uncharacterized protein KVP18_002160 [Porospora cf. gigantea A]|uniref:uncharacterized protein n=1 Tax=Porospora cf. gigantea A TaxID=2853593 RepID=UPI0035598717|nr:MAG: hypothetical protein KVP18_002160 [Porospora cf. gigantea A]
MDDWTPFQEDVKLVPHSVQASLRQALPEVEQQLEALDQLDQEEDEINERWIARRARANEIGGPVTCPGCFTVLSYSHDPSTLSTEKPVNVKYIRHTSNKRLKGGMDPAQSTQDCALCANCETVVGHKMTMVTVFNGALTSNAE